MKHLTFNKFALITCLIASSLNANASVLTFEGKENTIYNAPIIREGYQIGIDPRDEQHFHEITSTGYGLTSNGTGILLVDRFSRLTFSSVDHSPFLLGNFDAAWYNGSGQIAITGFRNGASVGSFTIGASSGAWTTHSGASLGVVDQLVFDGRSGTGNGMQFDNMNVAPVPEPETYALMGMGLVGLLAARRRKVKQA